jgi:hypothetical protein
LTRGQKEGIEEGGIRWGGIGLEREELEREGLKGFVLALTIDQLERCESLQTDKLRI